MPMYRVFFVDDEQDSIKPYIDFLERFGDGEEKFRASSANSIREARQKVEGRTSDFDALVLDMQMPWPEDAPRDEQEKFVFAGLRFLSNHLDAIIASNLPVFILTNMQVREIETVIEVHISDLPDMQFQIGRKSQTPAIDFPEILLNLINRTREA